MSALRSCIEQIYLEVFPEVGIETQLLGLSDGAYIGITCSPKRGLDVTLELVERLQGHQFHLVPHIAARQVRDSSHLHDIVQRLSQQGVTSLFVPGGDIPNPVGVFTSSLTLLRELANISHPFEHIGVAAYPEGHPTISDEVLFDELQAKQELATYMVTQMCFDPAALLRWLQSMRERGITLPAWLGLPGVMNRTKLLKTALRIGVGESTRFARTQSRLAGHLLRSADYTPDELLFQLEAEIANPALAIEGFYMFSFNQIGSTVTWRKNLLGQIA